MSEELEQSLGQYSDLCKKIDLKFDEIRSHYPKSFACGLGCHSCCKPGLTVNSIEKESQFDLSKYTRITREQPPSPRTVYSRTANDFTFNKPSVTEGNIRVRKSY